MTIEGSSGKENYSGEIIEPNTYSPRDLEIHNHPSWADIKELEKEIKDSNKKPVANEVWINKTDNSIAHIINCNKTEVIYNFNFATYSAEIYHFLLNFKYISGVECEKDLELFNAKNKLKLSEELNKNYEKLLKDTKERVIALEILLEQKSMRIRHLEEQIKEMRSGLKIGDKYKEK